MKFLASLALAVALVLTAQMSMAKEDTASLYANAVITADIPALEKLLAPNFIYVASNGHISDKAHFIQDIRDKKLVVNRLTLKNIRETSIGSTRLLTANGLFHGISEMPRPQGLMRFTLVITPNKDGNEQVVLFQATPVISTEDCIDGNCKIK